MTCRWRFSGEGCHPAPEVKQSETAAQVSLFSPMRCFAHKIDALPVIAPGITHTEPCKISFTHYRAKYHSHTVQRHAANMPQHVNIAPGTKHTKHTKTCQNMAVCHLKHFRYSNQNKSKHSNTASQKCLSKQGNNIAKPSVRSV